MIAPKGDHNITNTFQTGINILNIVPEIEINLEWNDHSTFCNSSYN